MRSSHKAEWKRYQEALAGKEQQGGGGIMNGSGVSSTNKSIFAPQDNDVDQDDTSIGGDTLSMLEEGAASFDGSSPMGGEGIESDTITVSSPQQSRAKVNTK